MISYWRLQEANSNTFADEKGSHDAIAASSSPSQTAGISGKAQLFNGSSYLSVPSHSDFNWAAAGSFSIELWAKFTEVGAANEVMIGRDDPTTSTHWYVAKTPSGTIEFFTQASNGSNGIVTTSTAYNNGQWHHIVAQRDGSQAKNYLYVDGVLQNAGGTTVTLTASLTSTADISIGNMIYNDSPMFYYYGTIDEVAFYSRVLTLTEITDQYNNMRFYQIGYCDGNSPVLFSTPNVYATVGQLYNYDVDASGNPVPAYTLIEKPTGMTIDATGLISWTPTSVTQNGHVVVRIQNSLGSIQQSFDIFISNPPVCRENLVAYWDFNETGGAPYYDNIASYELTGNASHTSGRVGTGLAFNGVSDSMNMIDNAEPDPIFFDLGDPYGDPNMSSFSIELWMKSSATPAGTMVLVGRKEAANLTYYYLAVQSDGTVEFALRDWDDGTTVSLTGGSVLNGAWHHIVGTFNSTTDKIILYVDKVNVAETNVSMTYFGGDHNLNIGYLNMDPSFFWYEGVLDEVAFYNTPLTEAQIISNYNDAVAGEGACAYNYAPVITTSPVTSVNQGSLYSYTLIATDGNEDDITAIVAITKPAWLTLTYNAADTFAVLSGTPGNANVGLNNVTLRVTDGSINIDQTFQINVININDPPTITSIPVATTNEDALYSYTIVGNDIDVGDVLTYSAPVKPDWLTLDADTHILSGTPTNDNVGIVDITVRVSDGTVNVDQPYQLTVNNVNDLPEVTSSPSLTVGVNSVYLYEFIATDVDEGDVLTFSVDSKPDWLTFTPGSTSGILTGTPSAADVGSHAIILKVSDGHGETVQGFTLVVSLTGIHDVDNSIMNDVYPNPATEKVYFRFAKTGKSRVEIYDISGMLHKQIDTDSEIILEINISDLSNGLYFYKVYQDNKVGIGKITKE
jgi:hypothetical protein